MLASNSQQDTLEVIKVYRQLKVFGVEGSDKGVRQMLTLIFSNEPKIQEAVVDTY